jgi:phosphatidylglycerophosphate synthase
VLAWTGSIPAWFLALVVARDLLIVSGGIYVKRKTGSVLPSNTAGKWAMGVVFVTLCASLVHAPSPYLEVCLAASVIMLGVSFVQYLRRFVQVIRSPREAPHGAS